MIDRTFFCVHGGSLFAPLRCIPFAQPLKPCPNHSANFPPNRVRTPWVEATVDIRLTAAIRKWLR